MKLLSSVSLRRLHVFLVVCDTLHMARAAEQLEIAQPSLSQQIHGLETALGIQLFHRRKRGIDLTAAGQLLQREAKRLLSLHADVIEDVRRTARGEMGCIAFGYVGSAMSGGEFPTQLKRLRENFPQIEFTLHEESIAHLIAALKSGDLDVALIRAPVPIEPPLVYRFHSKQELVAVIPAPHRLAEQEKVSIIDLAAEPMIGLPDTDGVGIMRLATQMAEARGTELHIKWQVSTVGSVFGLVEAGLGYSILPRGLALHASSNMAIRSLREPDVYAESWLVWHEQRTTPALKRFIDMVSHDVDATPLSSRTD